jgi:hypothetical protein
MAASLPGQRLAAPGSGPAPAGPSLALGSAALDFGAFALGQSSNRDLTLRNAGTAPLQVSALETAAPFQVISPVPPFSIAPGSSANVTVRFSPTAAGPHAGTLTIVSNDPLRPRASVALSGSGAATGTPLTASPAALDFGSVAVNSSRELRFTVSNPGGSPAQVVSIASSNPVFAPAPQPLPLTVSPGGETTFAVRFSPTTVGSHSGVLTIPPPPARRERA